MFNFTINDVNATVVNDSITPLEELLTESCIRHRVELFLLRLQKLIVETVLKEYEKDATFRIDKWVKDIAGNGGGITCVLQNGKDIEKVGCNMSAITGTMSKNYIDLLRKRGRKIPSYENNKYFATGMSFMLYPCNPHVPVLHFNYRFFEVITNENEIFNWFGGSCDMFPNYLLEEEFTTFHSCHKNVLDAYDVSYYPKFKLAADEYNFNKHREEHCGIGGIFFDDFEELGVEKCFEIMKSCACTTLPSYLRIFNNHINDVYTEKEKDWQLIRRGRYTEFVLVHGRGTKFGLTTPSIRVESVLMTLPLHAKWGYMYQVEPGSPEEKMPKILQKPRDWVI